MATRSEHLVEIPSGGIFFAADVVVPTPAQGVVVFAHGSGSSRRSPRNRSVAAELHRHGFATVLADLLTRAEEKEDQVDGHLRFDIDLLGERVVSAVDWVRGAPDLRHLPIGLFGASTGAAAALVAAAARPHDVSAVVSRGGRPDLAGPALARVFVPALFIVGSLDREVLALNERARRAMPVTAELSLVANAGHLFEEPGALDEVARLAAEWFDRYVAGPHVRAHAADGGR